MVTLKIEEKSKIEAIIKSCHTCSVGMIDTQGQPYVVPMNFGYEDGVVYLHSAPEGESIRSLEMNPNVCITFCGETNLAYQDKEVACSYRMKGLSAMCRGKVLFIEDIDEKIKALNILMKNYTDKPFQYSDPAVRNVKIWRVDVESMTGKEFGAPNPKSVRSR
ncbi:MAG: pyridoxamine 5'-phosphate oxidase family protein [Dysgonomonas sp.]